MSLLDKIASREATVSVIGLGYVGLPLALAFAEAGFRVIGIDVDTAKVEAINQGQSYVQDIPSATLTRYVENGAPIGCATLTLAAEGSLIATTDYDALWQSDAVIICVPTPLAKSKDPDVSYIINAADEIAKRLHEGMLIVLESTTYPGTTEEIILPRLQGADPYMKNGKRNGKKHNGATRTWTVGQDFFVAFSPERIDPGRKDFTVQTTPKVMGGITPNCLKMAQALYETAIERVVPVSSPRVAEMVKLLENTFRAVNIGLVNEVALMCDRLGIDVWEVIDAAKTKPYGFMPFYPGPGLGGHCIPIDPQYLAWKLRTMNYTARFIQLAEEINFGMPHYVLNKIADALNDAGKPLKDSRVLVLGVAYKADIGDLRESPALDIIDLLLQKGADVTYHDPYVPSIAVNSSVLETVTLDRQTLRWADCVVITTPHSSYDWQWVLENSRLVVDTRNATCSIARSPARIVRLGVATDQRTSA